MPIQAPAAADEPENSRDFSHTITPPLASVPEAVPTASTTSAPEVTPKAQAAQPTATPALTSIPVEQAWTATRSKAAEQIHRQASEGLKFVDEADDLRILPGIPQNFPSHLGETEIVPYMALYRGPNGEDEFGGHPAKHLLTPLTYDFCQRQDEFKDYPRSHFNAENIYQYGNLILCVMPKVTYDKYVADNPGTAELMRRRLNQQAKVINGEIVETKTEQGSVPGVDGTFVSTIGRLGALDHAGALKMMQAAR